MTDRELVAALRTRADGACARLFDAYGYELYAECLRLLGDPEAAQAALRDTLVVATAHADRLAGPGRLREWLLALARAECRRLPGADGRGPARAARPAVPAPRTPPAPAASAGSAAARTPDTPAAPPGPAASFVHPACLRVRILSAVTGPGTDGYRRHVAARGADLDRRGFPRRPARSRSRGRGALAQLAPGLAVTLAALLLIGLACLAGADLSRGAGRPPAY